MIKHFSNKVKVLCGKGALERIDHELHLYKITRALFIVDDSIAANVAAKRVKKLLSYEGVTIVQVTVKVDSIVSSENVALAYSQYVSSGSEVIVCIGGDRVASVGKAVKLLLSAGVAELSALTDINIADKVPLILLPTLVNGLMYAAGKVNVQDMSNNILYRLSGVCLQPNIVIIDRRIMDSDVAKLLDENILLTIGLSLMALTDVGLPMSAKLFAMTALDLLHGMYKDIDDKKKKTRYDSLMAAQIYASIAFDNSSHKLLDSIISNFMLETKVGYNDLFISIYSSYLSRFGDLFDMGIIDMIGAALDRDAYIKIEHGNKLKYLQTRYNEIVDMHKDRIKDYHLTALGIRPDKVAEVVGKVLTDMELEGNQEMSNKITNLLYEAM